MTLSVCYNVKLKAERCVVVLQLSCWKWKLRNSDMEVKCKHCLQSQCASKVSVNKWQWQACALVYIFFFRVISSLLQPNAQDFFFYLYTFKC